MLKKTALYFVFILIAGNVFAQKTLDGGIFVGRSYYLGELNPKTHVGNGVGNLVLGGLIRYNLNMRYSLRALVVRTKLTAEDQNVDFPFNDQRLGSFETNLSEISGVIEFNFFPYKLGDKKHWGTPYLFVGISYYSFRPRANFPTFGNPQPRDESGGNQLALPFGPGFKVNLTRKIALSAEWGFRRTGNDLLDGLENRVDDVFETGKNYDNDWFVVTGFSLTYRLTKVGSCPAYNF